MAVRAPNLEAAFDVLLLAAGCAIAYVSWGYGFGTLAKPGPGLYPFFLGIAIALLTFSTLSTRLKRPSTGPVFEAGQARTFALMALTFCLWIVAMPILGYVLVTFLATYAFCNALKLEGWRKPLAVALGTSGFIYVLFDYWLYIDLPRGIFG